MSEVLNNYENLQIAAINTAELIRVPDGFDRPWMLGAAAVAAFWYAKKSLDHINTTGEIQEDINYPEGNDYINNKSVKDRLKLDRLAGLTTGVVIGAAVTAGSIQGAGPYEEETFNEVEDVAIIVSASTRDGFIRDVGSENGDVARVEASVNKILDLIDEGSLDGVEATYIAAGSDPEVMGTIKESDVESRNAIVANFEDYLGDFSNRADANIENSLSFAKATNADKIIIISSDLTEARVILRGEEDPDVRRVSSIALGVPGSTIDTLGETVDGAYNLDANNAIVGENDSYSASSTDELAAVVEDIIGSEVKTTERNPITIFGKIAGGMGVVALALGTRKFSKEAKSIRKDKLRR